VEHIATSGRNFYPYVAKYYIVPIHGRSTKTWALALVSEPEMSNFSQGQENQGIARRRTEVRRTSDPADFVSLWLIDAEIAEKGHLRMETT
jgi:hypothetical protein